MKSARNIAISLLFVTVLSLGVLGLTVSDETLTPRWVSDQLLVSAPKLHFISGKSLERLRNGATVPFDFQLSISAGRGNPALQRALERFVVSYDVWEEKFRVIELRGRKSRAHLTAAAAEAWCLENIGLGTASINPSLSLWLRLEVRSAESKAPLQLSDDSGMSLATLIELFSRQPRASQEHWAIETGPFKLTDLKR
ncbi:MAG: hypothetical protein JO022_03380 [Acidobacteriaceae bacterium]|nr:hypothetical protein [Acidobacteriaceae bacterium]